MKISMKKRQIKTTGNEKKKYSYIKKKFAVNGFYSLGVSVLSLLLFAAAMLTGVSTAGNGGIVLGALGLSSFLMALMSLRFAFLSIREEGRNRIFALGSGVFDLIMILVWTALTVLGLNV